MEKIMTNYTYTDYTKFINELTVASNKTFDMSEVANLLYNVHGILYTQDVMGNANAYPQTPLIF